MAEGATNIAHGKLQYNFNNFYTYMYFYICAKSRHLSGVLQQNNEKAMGQTYI